MSPKTNPLTHLAGTASGSEVSRSITLSPPANEKHNRLVGFLVHSPSATNLNDATLGVIHDGTELFPETVPAKVFQFGDSVPPNQRMYQLPFLRHGQGELKFTLTHASAPASYTLTITGIYSNEVITEENEWNAVERLYTF